MLGVERVRILTTTSLILHVHFNLSSLSFVSLLLSIHLKSIAKPERVLPQPFGVILIMPFFFFNFNKVIAINLHLQMIHQPVGHGNAV